MVRIYVYAYVPIFYDWIYGRFSKICYQVCRRIAKPKTFIYLWDSIFLSISMQHPIHSSNLLLYSWNNVRIHTLYHARDFDVIKLCVCVFVFGLLLPFKKEFYCIRFIFVIHFTFVILLYSYAVMIVSHCLISPISMRCLGLFLSLLNRMLHRFGQQSTCAQ